MNQLLNISEQKASVAISSVEIAQLCEKRHDHVMVDIRKMLAELNLNSPEFSGQYKTKDGRMQPCYFLPKRETMILVSGYRIDLRAKIIDRLDELEKQHQPSIPKNYPEALRMAAELAEQNQVLLLEKQQTTAENHALKSYFEPGLTPAQFVKGLNGVNSNKINDYLRSRGWLYKEKHCWRVCSQFRDKYLTESFKRIEVDPVERIYLRKVRLRFLRLIYKVNYQ
ncbi:TPA: Rha family transcriptional regulator [Mannheimia haemolytica]